MDFSVSGRLHPLLVHLPIGILVLAFLFELFSRIKGFRKLRPAIRPMLFVGACAAVVSAFTGYWLSQEGGYDERLLRFHQYLGIATAFFATIVYLHRKYAVVVGKPAKRRVRIMLSLLLTSLLIATGHFGGSLTHGEDYLFATTQSASPAASMISIPDPNQARVFSDVIQPIFVHKCAGCHSSKKQKGQLRLDMREGIEKGGKHGEVIISGQPGASELFKRITLSTEEEHHMPPRERDQLTSVETDVIRLWIEEGASFDMRLREFKNPGVILEFIASQSSEKTAYDLPEGEISAAEPGKMDGLRKLGVLVLPMGVNSNYLKVSFVGKSTMETEDAILLQSISPQVVELDLSGCKISSDALKAIGDFPSLRKLYLQRSSITDAELKAIAGWRNLSMLNLCSTDISDAGISTLSGLVGLQKIYLYQSSITRKGFQDLHKILPQAQLDSGNYQLPFIASDTIHYKRNR